MHILYVHRSFPAQFGHIAARLIEQHGFQCTFVNEGHEGDRCGIRTLRYKVDDAGRNAVIPLARVFDDYARHCTAIHDTLKARAEIEPDLIVGHCGYGTTALLRELYDCPIINYFEYYYHRHNSDLDFRPDFPAAESSLLRSRIRNAGILVDLQNCDAGYSPTEWQRSRFPAEYQPKMETIFDGIDTSFWYRREMPPGKPRWVRGQKLSSETKVVTYVARGFESMRGFDIFMQVAKRLCKIRDDVLFVCVGKDAAFYGNDSRITGDKGLAAHLLAQESYDLNRFLFTGRVSPEELASIFSISDLHIYLTAPFVLSWSCMNALACGCTVLGSATPPVQEMIEHERNGLLADFYDVDRFVELANKALDDPQAFRPLGEAAVRMIEEKYSLDVCLPKMVELYERTVAGYTKCGFPQCRTHTPCAEERHTECADDTGDVQRAAADADYTGSGTGSNGRAKVATPQFTFSYVDDAKVEDEGAAPHAQYNGQRDNGAVRFERPSRKISAAATDARDRLSRPVHFRAEPGNERPIRVLFAIPHAFGLDPSKPYHSFNGPENERIEAMTTCLKLLHQTFASEQAEAALVRTEFIPANTGLQHEIDVVICTSGERHLLHRIDVPSSYYRHEPRGCDPVMLGFECHALLRDNLGQYDYFCYLEDDLLIHDPWFFIKQKFFNVRAGNECLLQPNRYEVEHGREHSTARGEQWHGESAVARKTYIDGDLDERLIREYQDIDDQRELPLVSLGMPIPCRRTLNPHCGGFFLNAEQMEHWARQRHFLDKDCSFFSPIESANTFGIMRTFKIYKPAPAVASFLEIEHFGTSMLQRLRQRDRRPVPALVPAS